MNKSIVLMIAISLEFLFSQIATANDSAVIVIRHAEEFSGSDCKLSANGTVDENGVKNRGKCLTSLGDQHALLYKSTLDGFMIDQKLNPITKVITIDPFTADGGVYPTPNPYFTIAPYLASHKKDLLPPVLIATKQGMNQAVIDEFNKHPTNGSTLIVWESKKLDTDVVGTALLQLLANDETQVAPNYDPNTQRDTLYKFYNRQNDGKYDVTVYHEFFKTVDSPYKRDYSGNLADVFSKSDVLTDMIYCKGNAKNVTPCK